MNKINKENIEWLQKWAGLRESAGLGPNVTGDSPLNAQIKSPIKWKTVEGSNTGTHFSRHRGMSSALSQSMKTEFAVSLGDGMDFEVSMELTVSVPNEYDSVNQAEASINMELDGPSGYVYCVFEVDADVELDGMATSGDPDDHADWVQIDSISIDENSVSINSLNDAEFDNNTRLPDSSLKMGLVAFARKAVQAINQGLHESISWHRQPKTKQEKAQASAKEDDAPKVRAKRNEKNLPSNWDDIPKSRGKNWKRYRKTQYKEEFSFLNQLEQFALLEDLVQETQKPPYNFDHRVQYDYGADYFDGDYNDSSAPRHDVGVFARKLETTYGKLGQRLGAKLREGEPVENLIDDVNDFIVQMQSAGRLNEKNRGALKSLLDLLWKIETSIQNDM